MMSQETRTIDGIQFTTTRFPAMRAFTLFGKLVKTIGPAVSVLQGADGQTEGAALAPAISAAFKDLDPDAATMLAAEVLSNTSAIVQGQTGAQNVSLNSPLNIDMVFSGRLKTMFKVLTMSVMHNFAELFSDGDVLGAALPPTTPRV